MQVMRVYFNHDDKIYYLELPDDEDVWRAIDRYDVEHETDFWDRLDEQSILGVNLGEYPDAKRVESWADVLGVYEITATKKVTTHGTSLSVIATSELRMLGLGKGDIVEVTFRRIN